MKKMVFVLFVGFVFLGCDMAIEDKVIGRYYLTAPDIGEQCSLTYKDSGGNSYSGIVPACVYAVGFNENYIIAKQHPYEFSKELDKTVINYYILPLKYGKNSYAINDLIGPLKLNEFNQKSQELGIENLKFSMVYDYME